jgi:hypothetical protein
MEFEEMKSKKKWWKKIEKMLLNRWKKELEKQEEKDNKRKEIEFHYSIENVWR